MSSVPLNCRLLPLPGRAQRRGAVRAAAGFSIIEVMMATAILLVGFIGLMQAITIGTESLDRARRQQIAVQLVTTEIEKLRGSSWSTITGPTGTLATTTATVQFDQNGIASGDVASFAIASDAELCRLARGFTCSVTRTYLRPAPATADTVTYVKLTYTVTWTSNTGRTQRHQVDTYLAKNGLHLSYQQS